MLRRLDAYVTERARTERKPRARIRFTQRELRETLGWGDFAVRRHLSRLVELEYVLVHRTGPGNQRQYELLAGCASADAAASSSSPSAG